MDDVLVAVVEEEGNRWVDDDSSSPSLVENKGAMECLALWEEALPLGTLDVIGPPFPTGGGDLR